MLLKFYTGYLILLKGVHYNGVFSIRLIFLDEPSVRPTFLSGEVGKTIVIRKTRLNPSFIKKLAETFIFLCCLGLNSCG